MHYFLLRLFGLKNYNYFLASEHKNSLFTNWDLLLQTSSSKNLLFLGFVYIKVKVLKYYPGSSCKLAQQFRFENDLREVPSGLYPLNIDLSHSSPRSHLCPAAPRSTPPPPPFLDKPDMDLTESQRKAATLTLTRTRSYFKCTPRDFSYREKGVHLWEFLGVQLGLGLRQS